MKKKTKFEGRPFAPSLPIDPEFFKARLPESFASQLAKTSSPVAPVKISLGKVRIARITRIERKK